MYGWNRACIVLLFPTENSPHAGGVLPLKVSSAEKKKQEIWPKVDQTLNTLSPNALILPRKLCVFSGKRPRKPEREKVAVDTSRGVMKQMTLTQQNKVSRLAVSYHNWFIICDHSPTLTFFFVHWQNCWIETVLGVILLLHPLPALPTDLAVGWGSLFIWKTILSSSFDVMIIVPQWDCPFSTQC